MKYTDRELDRLLEKLIASTRSPRGKFSAAASYQILEKRLPRPALRLFSLRTLSAVSRHSPIPKSLRENTGK